MLLPLYLINFQQISQLFCNIFCLAYFKMDANNNITCEIEPVKKDVDVKKQLDKINKFENLKLNIEDISNKQLEFSLNKLPETSLIYVNNMIDYKTPLCLLQQRTTINETTTTTTTPAVAMTPEAVVTNDTILSEVTNTQSPICMNNNESTENSTQLNESDIKKVDTKLEYGRPPPSAPRQSLDSKTSTTSLLRQFEQISSAGPTISSSKANKDTCSCNSQQTNDIVGLGNHRYLQATAIPPNITRICIRSVDPEQNFETTASNHNHQQTNQFTEVINKKWNDYYDSIRLSENYNNYRRRFECDETNQRQNQHHSVPDSKNCSELRNKRIERVKQEDILCNHLTVERGICNNNEANGKNNRNLRDQECQFPTPCARCLHNKIDRNAQNPSPLLEEPKFQTCETQTDTPMQHVKFKEDAQKLIDSCKKKIYPKTIAYHNTPPAYSLNNIKKDEYYNFLTPLFNDRQNPHSTKETKEQQFKKQQVQNHLDINIQKSSTPSNNCNHDSIDKETNTNLIFEDKAQQCPSPSFNNYRKVISPSISDKQCQYPTFKPQVGLRKYSVNILDDATLVDFNNKNASNNHQQYSKQPNAKLNSVKFNDKQVVDQHTIPVILPSKNVQTFYNGYKIWRTQADVVVDGIAR